MSIDTVSFGATLRWSTIAIFSTVSKETSNFLGFISHDGIEGPVTYRFSSSSSPHQLGRLDPTLVRTELSSQGPHRSDRRPRMPQKQINAFHRGSKRHDRGSEAKLFALDDESTGVDGPEKAPFLINSGH